MTFTYMLSLDRLTYLLSLIAMSKNYIFEAHISVKELKYNIRGIAEVRKKNTCRQTEVTHLTKIVNPKLIRWPRHWPENLGY